MVTKILVVGQADPDYNFLSQLLTRDGIAVAGTQTLAGAKEYLKTNAVSVILCEEKLPNGQWSDLLRWVKEEPNPRPQMAVVSRYADERLWAAVLNAGGYDTLMKPFDGEEVVQAVRAGILHRRHLMAETAARALR